MKTQHYLVRNLQHHVIATVAMDIAGDFFNEADRFTLTGQYSNYFESTTKEKYDYETKQLDNSKHPAGKKAVIKNKDGKVIGNQG